MRISKFDDDSALIIVVVVVGDGMCYLLVLVTRDASGGLVVVVQLLFVGFLVHANVEMSTLEPLVFNECDGIEDVFNCFFIVYLDGDSQGFEYLVLLGMWIGVVG